MSRKSARQFISVRESTQNSTTAIFVQNHTSPKHLLAQADALYVKGEIRASLDLVETIIDNNNALVSSADLFVLHAKQFIELHGFNIDAQCAITQALLLEPQHIEALELQKLVQWHEEFRDGLYESAQARIREFLAKEPDNMFAHYLLGYNLYWKNGAQTEAVELLEKCVHKRPSFLKAWQTLAMAYKRAQLTEKAETAFQECMALDESTINVEFYKNHLQSI